MYRNENRANNILNNNVAGAQRTPITYMQEKLNCMKKMVEDVQNALKDATAGLSTEFMEPNQAKGPFPVLTPYPYVPAF